MIGDDTMCHELKKQSSANALELEVTTGLLYTAVLSILLK